MGDFGVVVLVVGSALAGAGLVLLAQGRAARARGAEAVGLVDADLEAQLARAQTIPGAEQLLVRLSQQPVIFARELADFEAQLDTLERKAKVEATRRHVAAARRAPRVAQAAKEALAAYTAARTKPATRDIRNAEGELVAIVRPSCPPAETR
jgi:hypothetical protein